MTTFNFKNILKKIDVGTFFLVLYESVVWFAYFILNVTDNLLGAITMTGAVAILSYTFLLPIMKWLRRKSIAQKRELDGKEKLKFFLIVFGSAFLYLLIWLLAFYPGSFSADSISQYHQAVTGNYNDWHPAWHTILFFTIPLKITGILASIIALQMLYFSVSIGLMALIIIGLSNRKTALISCAYVLLNPYTGYILLYPMKDVGFAIFGLFSTLAGIWLICSKKKPKLWQTALLGLIIASATIFRHNAILFTFPLLIVFLLNIDFKSWIKIVGFTLLAFFLIKVPLYSALNVESPGNRVVETMGLPLTIIGNVAKETPERMDNELSSFVYSIASQEEWETYYQCGDFNSIKWTGIDTSCVEEQGYIGMIRLTLKCFKLSPHASLDALIALTDLVYGFDTGLEGNLSAWISENNHGISYSHPGNRLGALIRAYAIGINSSVFKVFRTYGVCLFALLAVVICKTNFKSWQSIKKALLVLPLFIYDFATMLLLTGPDSRFFYITFLLTPVFIVYLFKIGEKGENE